MKNIKYSILLVIVIIFISNSLFAQRVLIGPRLAGNFNIYNQKGLTGTYNGLGITAGGQVDVLFNKNIGMFVNVNVFDMKNFGRSSTANNVTTDESYSLSYASVEPLFQANFSGFYFGGGTAIGFKLNSSGEITQTATGQAPVVTANDIETKSVRFDIVVNTGYTFTLSPTMAMGTDFNVHIPVTDTYNTPGISNSILSLKLGVALKFRI
ncbi:MAG: hypothetical protein HGGPFJEG_02124 [Ignavibacteria bacterium]|nr:hypothetical protein [Ignavibacteria bacterium]